MIELEWLPYFGNNFPYALQNFNAGITPPRYSLPLVPEHPSQTV